MSGIIIVYMVILGMELSVGLSFIIWKCAASIPELECKLAIGGTILSVAIWMLVVLVCPCFMSPCEICDVFDKVVNKISHYLGKLQKKKHFKVYMHNEVYLPTTVSLLSNGQDDSVPVSEDSAELLCKTETRSKVSRHEFEYKEKDKISQQSENIDTAVKVAEKEALKGKHHHNAKSKKAVNLS